MALTGLDDATVATDRVTAGARGLNVEAAVPVQPPDRIELREYGRTVCR